MSRLVASMLRDKRWGLLGWSLGIFMMAIFTIAFFPSISQSGGFENLTESVPKQLQGLIGDTLSFVRYENYLGQQVFNFRLPLILLIFAVIFILGLTVGEEERGTLKTLQTLPVSRTKVVLAKWLVIVIATLLISVAAGLSVVIGSLLINEELFLRQILEASFAMWLLTLAVAGVVFALSMATGRKGLSSGLGSLFVAATIIVPTVTISTPELEPLAKSSLYYYFMKPRVFIEPPEPLYLALFAGVSLVGLLVAWAVYTRRDISAQG